MPLEQVRALHDRRLSELCVLLQKILAGRSQFTLEIGSGHGHFLTAYAERHPERFFVGIDIIEDRLDRSRRKSVRASLQNIEWVRAEAELFLDAMLALRQNPLGSDVSLEEILILFPDPWPKRRHWKNRLVQPTFLDKLALTASAGAKVCFRTDHAPYFNAAYATLSENVGWLPAPQVEWPFELSTVFQQRAETYQSCIFQRPSRTH